MLPCGTKAKSKVVALSSHFDLPARAGSLEQVTCTGHDSCSFCYDHGEVIKTSARGHVMTFPFRDTPSGHVDLRASEQVKAHSFDALERNATVSFIQVFVLLSLKTLEVTILRFLYPQHFDNVMVQLGRKAEDVNLLQVQLIS